MTNDLALDSNGDIYLTNNRQMVDCSNYPAAKPYYDPRYRNLIQNIFISLQTLRGEWPSSSLIGNSSENFLGRLYTYDLHKAIVNDITSAITNILPSNATAEIKAVPTSANACNITIKIVVNNTRIVCMQFPFNLVDGLVITGEGSSMFTHGDIS